MLSLKKLEKTFSTFVVRYDELFVKNIFPIKMIRKMQFMSRHTIAIRDLTLAGRQRDDGGQNHLFKQVIVNKVCLLLSIVRSQYNLKRNKAWLYDSNEFY